ncbi:polysaccharide deacetylase family protein [Clostridium luticellarii]|jgi:peptidoglycan/xylan/chitin deacetylase (PgdA/CDA1 family)|uniref:polysaccharide deacetylase family protein n=1 Tax=Clostridium luticellarii TaxID=1691940 RepID=UPI00235375DE|nr:polysaccharide deacetylase family protein [Clostridium luticellarii]MCI1945227.1 polysaccharide deacetylase [Clostridium luticellarii]MCI1969641.1 polysaccharide deacetylase [Clostridium luticellarii]
MKINGNNKRRKNTIIISILVLFLFSIGLISCTTINTKGKKSMYNAENGTTSNNSQKSMNNTKGAKGPNNLEKSTNNTEDTKALNNSEKSMDKAEDTKGPNNSANEDALNKTEDTAVPNNSDDFNPYKKDGRKVVYLTFDDGPSANNTPKILDILDQYNIKATFFLIGENAEQNEELVKEEAAQGNVVGNHTYSHDMNYIYSDPKVFMEDIYKCQSVLSSILGKNYNLKLVRFPGGSFGDRLKPFREELIENGYHYVDWNDLNGDAEHNNVSVENLIYTTKKYAIYDHLVVLMHDAPAKTTTVQALPAIIEYFKSQGYSFETLK